MSARVPHFSFAVVLFALTTPLHAATRTWTGGASSTLWSDPDNWSPHGLPGTTGADGDHISVAAPATVTCDAGSPVGSDIRSVTFGSGTTYHHLAGSLQTNTFDIQGRADQAAGTINAFSVRIGGEFSLTGGGIRGRGVAVDGSVDIAGGSLVAYSTLSVSPTARLVVSSGLVGGDAVEISSPVLQTGGRVGSYYGLTIAGPSGAAPIPYTLVDGVVSAGERLYLSNAALTQTGGSVASYANVAVGSQTDGPAHYSISAGSFSGRGVSLTPGSTFSQTGGSVDADFWRGLGVPAGATASLVAGTFRGSLGVAGDLVVGSDLSFAGATCSLAPASSITLINGRPRTEPLFRVLGAALAGTFTLDLDPAYIPREGDQFPLFTATGFDNTYLTGQFTTLHLPPLPVPLAWQPTYTATSFGLTIIPEPAVPLVLALASLRRPTRNRRRRNRLAARPGAMGLLAILLTSPHLPGATRTWTGAGGNLWSDPNNWSPVGTPLAGSDEVVIDVASPTSIVIDVPSSAFPVYTLDVSGPVTFLGSATTTIRARTGHVLGTFQSEVPIHFDSGASLEGTLSKVRVSAGSGLGLSGAVGAGANISGGAMRIGATNVTQTDGAVHSIGDTLSIAGTYALSGGSAAGETVLVRDGATLAQTGGRIGAAGLFLQGTPVAPAQHELRSGVCNLFWYGNSLVVGSSSMRVSQPPSPASAVLHQAGGEISGEDENFAIIGDRAGDVGAYNLSGGSVRLSGIRVGRDGTGTFTQTGGTVTLTFRGIPFDLSVNPFSSASLLAGSFSGNITAAGRLTLAPAAQLSVPKLTLADTATISFTNLLPSPTPLLALTEPLTLAGQYTITLDPAYTPHVGDSFTLLTTSALTAAFSSHTWPTLPDGFSFREIQTTTSFSLRIIPEPTLLPPLAFAVVALRRRPSPRVT